MNDLSKGDFFGEELLTGEKVKVKVRNSPSLAAIARVACTYVYDV